MAEVFRDKNLFALPSRCFPLSHIKEMARGPRDGNIFRSPDKRFVLTQNTLSTDMGMAEGFPDKKFCRPGHLEPGFSIRSIRKSSPYFVREWRSTFGTKVFRVAILSNPQEVPLLIRKWRGGFGTSIFLPCAENLVLRRVSALRQNATSCDNAMICGKTRPITAFHGNAIAPATSPTPPMRQLRWVVEHKGNV